MTTLRLLSMFGVAAAALTLTACPAEESTATHEPAKPVLDCAFGHGEGAPSTCLQPTQPAVYYVDQAEKYFDTLDTSADPMSVPAYSELSARWEWPPWLKLTGYEAKMLLETNKLVLKKDPSTVTRDCQAFTVQPFARCHVSFEYAGGACAIYEEFTFNDQGEMTFIEAWSDRPDLLPMKDPADRWAEAPGAHRLSTKIPGLGNAEGRINPSGTWMTKIAAEDPEVADFATRAQDFWGAYFDELGSVKGDIYKIGCGW
jgi:hypothetical protein